MMGYKTKHKDALLEYMKSLEGQHINVNDIYIEFAKRGTSIGTATIYRQLESLVSEGLVYKFYIDENSSACFAYIGHEGHPEEHECYHCKCEKCGKLIHLHCEDVKSFKNHLNQHHGFLLNAKRTVFYGVCEDCQI